MGPPGDLALNNRKCPDPKDSDVRRQRRPSDHRFTFTNLTSSTWYRTKNMLCLPPPLSAGDPTTRWQRGPADRFISAGGP